MLRRKRQPAECNVYHLELRSLVGYSFDMATVMHNGAEDLIKETDGLLDSLRSLARHTFVMIGLARILARDARTLASMSSHICKEDFADKEVFAGRIEAFFNRSLEFAERIKGDGIAYIIVRHYLLDSAVWFAKAASLLRAEDPAMVPELDPWWRSLLNAMSDMFRFV